MPRKVKGGNGNGDQPTAQDHVDRVNKALKKAARARRTAKRPTPLERAARKAKANDDD